MASSGLTELANLIPEIWSPKMYEELRASNQLFTNFFAKEYEGEIRSSGDTVRVNTLAKPTAEDVYANNDGSFNKQAVSISQQSIVANHHTSAAFEISDIAMLQSLEFQAEAQKALLDAIKEKMESDIIALLIPSAAAPDHDIAPAVAGDLATVDVATARTLLSTALVPMSDRVGFVDPQYYGDLLQEQQMMSRDYTSGNSSEAGVADKFLGFGIVEHNLLAADTSFWCHKSALQVVMQRGVRVKLSDSHSAGRYAFTLSADIIWGAKLMDNTRLVKISG